MRKVIVFIFVLVVAGVTLAQQDSATIVIDRYLNLLNYNELPTDSMLYIETQMVDRNNTDDTVIVKRWYQYPNSYRTEIWINHTLDDGFFNTNDSLRRYYDKKYRVWRIPTIETYYDMQRAYNFHGPFFYWRSNGTELYYEGTKTFQGHLVQQVLVRAPAMLDRHYIFEKESGLLFLFTEDTTHLETRGGFDRVSHVDWRAIHEFQPVNAAIFPSIESYQSEGRIYIIKHRIRLLPRNNDIFKKEKI